MGKSRHKSPKHKHCPNCGKLRVFDYNAKKQAVVCSVCLKEKEEK